MICRKNKIIGFGILLPVLLSAFFVSPSYGISDYTYTLDSSSTIPFIICDNTSSVKCSDYNYALFYPNVSATWLISSNSYSNVNFTFDSPDHLLVSATLRLPRFTSYTFSLSSIRFVSLQSNMIDGTVVLSDSLPSSSEPCPEPEEPEPCPTCPVVPDNPYDDKLDNITKAIYVCAGTLLVLYFFYTIYRIIIRNSGVK